MSDTSHSEGPQAAAGDEFTPARPFGRRGWRTTRGGKISIDPTPTAENRQLPDHPTGEHADQFSALYPRELDQETRNVRLDMSFDEPIKIRDQAQMILVAMQEIIELTKKHDLGSKAQRMQCRYTAAVLGRTLSRFNGKTPYGDTVKKKR